MTYSIIMQKNIKLLPILFGILCVYLLGYAFARVSIFHTVERYAGAEGKGDPRQDYIAKKDRPAGEGWEYQLFLPVIKAEEGIVNYFHNL
jgi:hypothetical protein